MTEECVICEKELKGSFYWVACKFWGWHGDNCNCVQAVGTGCIKKVPKKFVGEKTTVEKWDNQLKKMMEAK